MAVGQHDDHVPRLPLRRELARGEGNRIEERRPGGLVGLERAQRRVGVGRGVREARQGERLVPERDHLDPVAGALCADERPCGGNRVGERLAAHRLRVVDQQDDALRPPEIVSLEAGHAHGARLLHIHIFGAGD